MAGEADSSTSVTLAFQKKRNAEWCKLRKHLHLQLQQDIARTFSDSLYCDLELIFDSTTIKTHRSILQVRAARFFSHLCNKSLLALSKNDICSLAFEKASSDYIKDFVRNVYCKCAIAEEENDIVQYLQSINEPCTVKKSGSLSCKFERGTSQDSGLSPESDIYLTPNCSPSDFCSPFCKEQHQKVSSEINTTIPKVEDKISTHLHKTNRSYYTIVAVDEVFREDPVLEHAQQQSVEHDVLAKELAEQDKLLESFKSIKSKEKKIIRTTRKINKPTSLPVSSSLYSKKQKQSYDAVFLKDPVNKKEKNVSEFRPLPPYSSSSKLFTYNSKESNEENLKKSCSSKKSTFLAKLCSSFADEKNNSVQSVTCFSTFTKNVDLGIRGTKNNLSQNEEEEFMFSPKGDGSCGLRCCQDKDLDDFLTLTPCSPEMDASGGGPDSGLDTCSTGCVPGGGFNSPREHTVSETSGVDLTEAAIGEDMPHDGDSELNLPKPSKSSDSSSVSSEAGTWDTTFPPSSTVQDLQNPKPKTDDDVCHEVTENTILGECTLVNLQTSQNHVSSASDNASCVTPDTIIKDISTNDAVQKETNIPLETDSDLGQKTDVNSEDRQGEHSLKFENMNDTFDVSASDAFNESNASEILTDSCDTDALKHRRKVSSLGDLQTEYLVDSHQPTSGEKCNDWKIDTSIGAANNYFINAATLVDDSELPTSLPPLYIHETSYKVKEPSSQSEREDHCDNTTKTPTSSPTEIEEETKHMCVSHEGVMINEVLKLPIHENSIVENNCEAVEPVLEKEETVNNTQGTGESENSYSEPPVMRVTFLKMGGTRHEVKLLNGQDLFAEFQKELRMTEHLEPQVVRKVPGGKFKWDSETLDNEELHPENDIIIDNSAAANDDIQEKHEIETVNEDEGSHIKELEDDEKYLHSETERSSTHVSDGRRGENLEKSPEEESEDLEAPRRPSLIRRNTFELDPDEEHIALLRQEYERRQGNLLFQNCIPQFSGHITGSEGFRDAQSLLVLGTENGGDMHKNEEQQMSLPGIPVGNSLLQMSVVDTDTSLPCQVQSAMSVDDSCSDQQFSNFQNESTVIQPLNCITQSGLQAINGEINEKAQDEELNEHYEYHGIHKIDDENNQSEYDTDEHSMKNGSSGFTRQSSYDIACKPVISGALTCSDLGLEDKRLWDSPKKHQKRTESTPIVSGGVSTIDFSVPVRKVSESPIMRRKNEAAPILSGAAPVSPEQKEALPEVKPQPSASTAAAWVVDMSDCAGNAAKPPLDSRKHKKSDSTTGLHQLQGPSDLKEELKSGSPLSESKSVSSLGFFVDLKVSPGKEQSEVRLKEKRENIQDVRLQKSLESTPVNVGYFVGFEGSRSHSREKWDRKSSSFEEKRDLKRQTSKSDDNKSSGKNSPCGFFVDLTNKGQNGSAPKDTESKRLSSEDEKDNVTPDRKSAIFSMFIDIGDSKKESSGRHGSAESVKSKVASSPLLSSNKKLGLRRASLSRDSSDRGSRPNSATFDIDDQLPQGESPKSTFMYIDASTSSSKSECTVAQSQPSSLEEVNEHKANKKQSFFMFIENESPVIRRKTLPSGLRPSFNRHSWNPETRSTLQTEDTRLTARRQHKRAHSVSVDRSSICSPGDEHKSSSSSSLAKTQQQGSSHSLCESAMPSEVGMPQMSVSCHARLSSKSQEKFLQRTFSVEEQTEDDISGNSVQTNVDHLSHKAEVSGNINVKFTLKEANVNIVEVSDLEKVEELELQHAIQVTVQDRCASKRNTPVELTSADVGRHQNVSKDLAKVSIEEHKQKKAVTRESYQSQTMGNEENFSKQAKSIPESSVCVSSGGAGNNRKTEFVPEMQKKGDSNETKKKVESSGGNFVRLSDLDKEPNKANDVTDSSDILPSFSATNRMTRSIPETSWIENKLLMTRSIGSGSTSKSLSRLFPHLHTGGSASSSPSSATYSKSPGGQMEVDDNDMQVSETSDLSSMQSSMGPSGLEGSTEETDASSSYAGRSGPVSRLGEDLLRMFLEEINPDVTVEVGGRRLKAHKCILSSRCQYFAAMLSGGWVESAGNVISLQGFSYNAVHFALCHIYSGTSNIPDTISIVELATLADMLGLEGLKEVIMYTLKVKYCHFFHKPCTMCTVGVLECLPLAAAYGLDEIYRKSLRWITKYFVRIWPTKGFASLPRELVEKCYQQHVVYMSVDNVLETVMCCDKLMATLPNVRWAEPVFGITSQLLEASIKYIANNFSGVLASENFLSLGKELSWNISRLEDSIMAATDRLPPDQCCQSYSRLHQILSLARSPEPPPEMQWMRQAPRAARCPSWGQMEPELRRKIQEIACLVLVPGEDHRSRLSNITKRGTSGSSSVYCTGPRSVSSTGLRSLDLRQVRLAMTQQARRAASGGRVSTLKADSKAKAQAKQPHTSQVKKEAVTTDDSSKASNGETAARPKTWPMRVLENKSRSTKYRVNSSTSSTGTPEKSNNTAPRRSGKNLISSSDSSRTSSPAMRRSAPGSDSSGRVRASTLSGTSGRGVVNRSDTPPGRDMRTRRKRDGEIAAISTDSLTESPSNGSTKRSAKELSESATSRSCQSTRPDTPSVRRKVREDVVMSTDSLSSAANGEKTIGKECTSVSAPSHSSITTRPETPKDRKKNALGRLGVEVTISTDSLATDSSYAGDASLGAKESGRVSSGSSRNENKAGKIVKLSNVKNDSQRSPASAVRKITRQSVSSPRDSPTTRIRSAVSSSPYTGSPSLRRSLLLASKPENAPPTTGVKQLTPSKATAVVKSEKLTTKLLSSPSTSSTTTKRTPTRNQIRQVVASPAKPIVEGVKCGTGKCASKETVSTCTPNKTVTNKISNVTKKTANGSITDGRNKRFSDCHTKLPPVSKREAGEEKPPTVGSRSGTFLKDEPTILKKPDIDNVQE
ncbi:Protein roadkill [Gryllus bimaculatus]|nr:Protein roadkill [Gryllus bimaculatus]